jgi:hypothetical protein
MTWDWSVSKGSPQRRSKGKFRNEGLGRTNQGFFSLETLPELVRRTHAAPERDRPRVSPGCRCRKPTLLSKAEPVPFFTHSLRPAPAGSWATWTLKLRPPMEANFLFAGIRKQRGNERIHRSETATIRHVLSLLIALLRCGSWAGTQEALRKSRRRLKTGVSRTVASQSDVFDSRQAN